MTEKEQEDPGVWAYVNNVENELALALDDNEKLQNELAKLRSLVADELAKETEALQPTVTAVWHYVGSTSWILMTRSNLTLATVGPSPEGGWWEWRHHLSMGRASSAEQARVDCLNFINSGVSKVTASSADSEDVPSAPVAAVTVTLPPRTLANSKIQNFVHAQSILRKFRYLKRNWNGYGAPVPSPRSLDLAEKILRVCEDFGIQPNTIAPDAMGGVAIYFWRGDNMAWISILNDDDLSGFGLFFSDENGTYAPLEYSESEAEIESALRRTQEYLAKSEDV